MTIASLRFHWLLDTRDQAVENAQRLKELSIRHLWSYTLLKEASRAILLSLTADFNGHEVFYITAPYTSSGQPSSELARQYYPHVEIRGDFADYTSFFDCAKAARLLGWKHKEN
jgi:UDP-glucose 4-epimerase